MAASDRRVRCGLVGPGRTRNGLGPFLARDLEAAGAEVVAVAGRDLARTRAAARALGERLGHDVTAHAGVGALIAAQPLDALVVASPIPAHLEALCRARDAGLAVLCEKPLVAPEQHDEVGPLAAAFVASGRLLMENCQLPYVLGPAFDGVAPGLRQRTVEHIELHMAPSGRGLAMLVDSVSHFVSVVQALLPVDASTTVARLAVQPGPGGPQAKSAQIELMLESPFPAATASLYLERRDEQPRPQWFALNGVRVERRIDMADYSMTYCGPDGRGAKRCVPVPDPLAALTQAFVAAIREPRVERIRAEAESIVQRARLYRRIVGAWPDC